MLSSALVYSGCGKQTVDGEIAPVDGEKVVKGTTYFGSQCTLGTLPDAAPAKMGALECDTPAQFIELSQAPSGFLFQADCKKLSITVRSKDGNGKIDGNFKMLPNGTFNLSITDNTVGSVGIRGATGTPGCTAFPTLDLAGAVDCTDLDHAVIQVDTLWNLSKGKAPTGFSGSVCALPPNCRLHSSATVRQCP